jgi:PAS domain S-box-containing protein
VFDPTTESTSIPRPIVACGLDETLRSWKSLAEWLPVGVCVSDRNGLLAFFNSHAAALWGRRPRLDDPQVRFCGAYRIHAENDSVLVEPPMSEVLRTGRPMRDRELVLERPDGTRLTILANLEPIIDAAGEIVGGVECFQDITERRRAEALVHEEERRMRELLDALPAALYTTDAAGRITFCNEAAALLAGRRPQLGIDQWCVTWRLFSTDGTPLPHERCPMAVALGENRPVRGVEFIVERPDGTRAPVIPYPTPLRDSDGKLVGAVNMLVDISERKQSEMRQRALVDELNHRMKNTLATVQSLAAQTLSERGVPAVVREDFEARLFALSRMHDHLTREHWESAEFGTILDEVFAPYRGDGRVRLAGTPVQIAPRAALTLGMVLHELASNAVKYGALSTMEGRIDVSWNVAADTAGRRLEIEWRESGGPVIEEPRHGGFGTRLLERGIAHELGGTAHIAFERAGVHCRMIVPLPASGV